MLGETNGGSGQIEADAIDQLLDRIKGNGGGSDGGGDGDGGEDPYDAPVSIKMLLEAVKQIAEYTAQIGRMSLKTTEALSDATIGAIHDQHDAMEAIAKQLHSNAMSISNAIATRFEAIEERLLGIETHLGGKSAPRANGAVEDAGGGP
jgi:hypothetical protein